jgi:hypothetical protein
MKNNNYLPPFLLSNVLLNLTDTGFSYLGPNSSLFFYLFSNSEKVLNKYHRQFDSSSVIVDSTLLFRLCVEFIQTRPLYFKDLVIKDDESLISVKCKDSTIKIYNNSNIYNDNNFLNLLDDSDESYMFDNLININLTSYHNIDFKLMSLEDTVCSLFFNYYHHKNTNSLLDAITLCSIYNKNIIYNKLVIRCLQIYNTTTPFLHCLAATEYLEYNYLYELNYTLEYIKSTVNKIKELL